MLFVPLTTISMDPIPRERMGNATGLFSLMRNIGGSIGIAVTGTMLARLMKRPTGRGGPAGAR
jgi:DHA2 family multidrug resistance protein